MTWNLETDFLLRRAKEEAILAIKSGLTPAAAAHDELSLRYSVRVREALEKTPAPIHQRLFIRNQ